VVGLNTAPHFANELFGINISLWRILLQKSVEAGHEP